jgi:hypothetical protein
VLAVPLEEGADNVMAARRLTPTGTYLQAVRDEDVAGPPAEGRQLLIPPVVRFLVERAPRQRCASRRPPPIEARLEAQRQLLLRWRVVPKRSVSSRKRKSLGNEPMTRAEKLQSRKLQIWRLPQLPETYGECEGRARPCYFFRCRHNLYLDVNPESGSIVLNFPGKEPHELEFTCAIDAALDGASPGSDRGNGHTLDRVGEFLNVTLERARQTEAEALGELRAKLEDQPIDFGTDEVDEFEEEDGE